MDEHGSPEPHLVFVLLAVTLCSILVSGCGGMEISEQAPAPLGEVSQAGELLPAEHDLAVLAIDFDPPLDSRDLWTEWGDVTLLAAVENRGLTQESGVTISVSLSAPRTSEFLLERFATLSSLAPGEVQVVRFAGISNVPYRSAYRLVVEVSPAEGEWILSNNARIYELTIKEPAQAPVSDSGSPLRRPKPLGQPLREAQERPPRQRFD